MKGNFQKIGQAGFSTIEIIMAMFVLVICLVAVTSVSFGNQSMISDSQSNAAALNVAQGLLEKAQADSRKDFNLVNPVDATTTTDGFTTRVTVEQNDYFSKLVTASVDYREDGGRTGNTQLSTLVTNFNNAVGGDTCSSVLLPDANAWKTPAVKNATNDLSSLGGVSGNFAISDVDAYKGRLYVAVGKTDNDGDPTFFVFDISNPSLPALLGKTDNNASTTDGFNAVAVAEDPMNHRIYAYAASNSASDQLQVIDVTNPAAIGPGSIVKFDLDILPYNVSGSQGKGNSIFFKDGYIYLGLQATGGSGPEFVILDVHADRSHPEAITGNSFYSVGNAVNAITVRGKYAYLQTPNSQELIVLDVHDPSCVVTNPQSGPLACKPSGSPWGFGTSTHNGKSGYLLGDNLYFGTTVTGLSTSEFYILDNADPATSTLPVSGQRTDISGSIETISVRDSLAFLLTKTNLKVVNIKDPSSINDWGILSLNAGSGEVFEPSMDCEGNNFFIGSNVSGHGYLSVVAP